MARKAGQISRVERAPSLSASILGAIRRRWLASTTNRPFTVRFAKRSAFSIQASATG